MKLTSTFALAVSLALGTASAAAAQGQGQAQAQAGASAQAERKFNFSKEARPALANLQKVVNAKDAANFPAALAAAEAAAKNADDRYMIGQLRLSHALSSKDDAATVTALEAIINSGGVAQAELPRVLASLATLHYNAKRFDQAASSLERLVQLTPNAPEPLLQLAEIRAQQNNRAEAVNLLQRAIDNAKRAGQTIPENWYKRGLKFAYDGKLGPQTIKLSRDLITAYPTPTNWSDAIIIFRQSAQLDKTETVDLYRLMRAAKLIKTPADYFDYAQMLSDTGIAGEAKAVLDEGVAAGVVQSTRPGFKELIGLANQRIAGDRASLVESEKQASAAANGRVALNTADAYLGYRDYAKAVSLYRLALQKGGIDANLANTRLGIALALAGQKAEAETALKAVTGSRSDLASLWLLWLNQRA